MAESEVGVAFKAAIPVTTSGSCRNPCRTRASEDMCCLPRDHFDELMERATSRAPARRLVTIEDAGLATAVLATDHAKLITGETVYVDGGYHILG
jgi:Enoyl-[acyl-carrier-protein] reductase (NADH)